MQFYDRENEIKYLREERDLSKEVKRDPERISLDQLRGKAEAFMRATGKFSDYRIEYKALSLSDM